MKRQSKRKKIKMYSVKSKRKAKHLPLQLLLCKTKTFTSENTVSVIMKLFH